MSIQRFSVNRPVTASMIVLIIVVYGFISFRQLQLDLFPDIEYPVLSISTRYDGVHPEEIESLITKPIEGIVSTISGIKRVSSISVEGISTVLAEFEWGTDLASAAQDVRDQLELLKPYLPKEAATPIVYKYDITQLPLLVFGAAGLKNTRELTKYLNDNICPLLERLEGVATAAAIGGPIREIEISINQAKLDGYNLSFQQVVQALRMQNLNQTAGYIQDGRDELLIRTIGEYKDIEEIKLTPIANNIYLKDIAEVNDTHKEIRNIVRANQKDSVVMIIMREAKANIMKTVSAVNSELARAKKSGLLRGIDLFVVLDQSEMIKRITSGTVSNAIFGAILAIILIYLFLLNWRTTVAISLAIPISVIITFIAIYLAGHTLNIMTLAGLALGIGMLVDNGIVVIENISRHLESGKNRQESAIIGSEEVGTAITVSTLTTIIVFLPLAFSQALAGKLARGVALTVSFSLLSSLFVALSLVPVFASRFFKYSSSKIHLVGGRYFQKLKDVYEKILRYALAHKRRILIIALVLFILSLLFIPFIGTEFFPKTDVPMILFNLQLPAGTPIEESTRIVSEIERLMLTFKEVDVVFSTIGVLEHAEADIAMRGGVSGVNEAEIILKLVDEKRRKKTAEEIINELRKKMFKLKDVKMDFLGSSFAMLMGAKQKPVEIKISGKDLDKLKYFVDIISDKIRNISGVKDVDTTFEISKPELQIRIDKIKAAKMGLSTGMIATEIKSAIEGTIATRMRLEGEEINLRVKLREIDTKNISQLKNIQITSIFGKKVPLASVAEIYYSLGPVRIERENQARVVSVVANTYGRDLGSILSDVKAAIKEVNLPAEYLIQYAGEFEAMLEAFRDLGIAVLLSILLVYMLMAALYESFLDPFVIMFTIPLGIIGILFALFITGKTISLVSIIGVIMFVGITVNNAIVLIDHINQLRKKGMDMYEAIVTGSMHRLRPILITSLTTIFGLLPMALSTGRGAEIRSPIAVSIIGGLIASTFLTLIIIPVIYAGLHKVVEKATTGIPGVTTRKPKKVLFPKK